MRKSIESAAEIGKLIVTRKEGRVFLASLAGGVAGCVVLHQTGITTEAVDLTLGAMRNMDMDLAKVVGESLERNMRAMAIIGLDTLGFIPGYVATKSILGDQS